MSLPTYNSSLISAVGKAQQNTPFPQFVLGGRGGAGGTTYALFKKSTTYVYNVWRSQVFNIGKNFDILTIKFPIIPDIAANMSITPVLCFDNGASVSVGTVIDSTNYTNSERLIKLTSKTFGNSVHGRNNFYIELRFEGTALTVVELPITFELEIEE